MKWLPTQVLLNFTPGITFTSLRIVGHAFAVHHKEKGSKDDKGPGVRLEQNQRHGHNDQEVRDQYRGNVLLVEVQTAQIAPEGNGRTDFGKFRGLDPHGTEAQPGVRPVYCGHEKHDDQQNQAKNIDRDREFPVDAGIDEHHEEAQEAGKGYPKDLFSVFL